MDFALLPPEVNSSRMYAGPGAAPLLAAATAWDGLAAELHAVGMGYESTIAELHNGWAGPSATAMAAAAQPYVTWMHSTAIQAEQTATQAKAAAAAYEAAFTMTVPPPVIAANRSQLMALLATNVLGQNTPAIAATEAHYLEMWAQDATAMYQYAGSAATAATLTPFTEPPQTTNPAGSTGGQAAAIGQASATAAATTTQGALSQLSSSMPTALQGLAAPTAGLSSLSSASPAAAVAPELALAWAALGFSAFGALVVDGFGTFGVDAAGSFGVDVAGVGVGLVAADIDTAGLFPGWGLMNLVPAATGAPLSAGLGQAASVGALSVPQAWTAAAPSAIQYISTASTTSAAAAPAVAAGESSVPFAEMATAGVAGRALAGAVGRGRSSGTRGEATLRRRPAAPKEPPSSRVQSIGADLRELAELRDAGLLTDEEFTDEKRRLLGSGE